MPDFDKTNVLSTEGRLEREDNEATTDDESFTLDLTEDEPPRLRAGEREASVRSRSTNGDDAFVVSLEDLGEGDLELGDRSRRR